MIRIGIIGDIFFKDCIKEELSIYGIDKIPKEYIEEAAREMERLVNSENWDLDCALRKAITDTICKRNFKMLAVYKERIWRCA